MSSYAIRGRMMGRRVKIEWTDGKLSGDQLLVDFVNTDARLLEGRPVGPPTGPFNYTNHLNDPLAALFIIRMHLDDGPEEFIGDIPTVPGQNNRIY